jgi:hypothetical protein
MFSYIKAEYDLKQKGIDNIICPLAECENIINAQTIQKVCGDELTHKLAVRSIEINMEKQLFQCPKCSNIFEIPEDNKNRNLGCGCGYGMCRLCKQDKHDGNNNN